MRKSRKHTGGNVFALSTHRTNLRRLFVMFALLVTCAIGVDAYQITYHYNSPYNNDMTATDGRAFNLLTPDTWSRPYLKGVTDLGWQIPNDYVFDCWTTNISGNGGDKYKVGDQCPLRDITVYAQWKKLYTLNVSTNQGGTVSIKRNDTNETIISGSKVPAGTSVSYIATPDANYHFVSWSDNGGTANPYTFNVSNDIWRNNASFAINPRLNITCSAPADATITITDRDVRNKTYKSGDYVEPGTRILVNIQTKNGARFTGWSDGNNNTQRDFTVNNDITLTANVVSDIVDPKFYDGYSAGRILLEEMSANSFRVQDYDEPNQQKYIRVICSHGETVTFNNGSTDNQLSNVYWENQYYRLNLKSPAYGEHKLMYVTVTSSDRTTSKSYAINVGTRLQSEPNLGITMKTNTNTTKFGFNAETSEMRYKTTTAPLANIKIDTDYRILESDAKPNLTAMLKSNPDNNWTAFQNSSVTFSYTLPEGETFTPKQIFLPIQAENSTSWFRVHMYDDNGNEIKNTPTNSIPSDVLCDYVVTNTGNVTFRGKISLTVYGYGTSSKGFRIGDQITLKGDLNGHSDNNTDLESLDYDGITIEVEEGVNQYTAKSASKHIPFITAVTADPFAKVQITQPTSEDGTGIVVITAADGVTQKEYTIDFTASSPTPSSDVTWDFTKKGSVKNVNGETFINATDEEGNVYRLDLNLMSADDYGNRLFLERNSGTEKIALKGITDLGHFRVNESMKCDAYKILQNGNQVSISSAVDETSEEIGVSSSFSANANNTYTFDFNSDVRISQISWEKVSALKSYKLKVTVVGSSNKKDKVTVNHNSTSRTINGGSNYTFTITEGTRVELNATNGNYVFQKWEEEEAGTISTIKNYVIDNINNDLNITAYFIPENDVQVLSTAMFTLSDMSSFGIGQTTSIEHGGTTLLGADKGDIKLYSPTTGVTGLGNNKGCKVTSEGSFKIQNKSKVNGEGGIIESVLIVTDEGTYSLSTIPTEQEKSVYGKVWTYDFNDPQEVTFTNNTSRTIIIKAINVNYSWHLSNAAGGNAQNPYFASNANITTYVGTTGVPMPKLTVKNMVQGTEVQNPNVEYISSDESVVRYNTSTKKLDAVGIGSVIITAKVTFTTVWPATETSFASFIVDSRDLDTLNVTAPNIFMYDNDAEQAQPNISVYYKQDNVISHLNEGDDYTLSYEILDAGKYYGNIKGGTGVSIAKNGGNWATINNAKVLVTITPTESAVKTYHVKATTALFTFTVQNHNEKVNVSIDAPKDIYLGHNKTFILSPRIITPSGEDVTDAFSISYNSWIDNVATVTNGVINTKEQNGDMSIQIRAIPCKEFESKYSNNAYYEVNLHVKEMMFYTFDPKPADITLNAGDYIPMPIYNIRGVNNKLVSDETYTVTYSTSAPKIVSIDPKTFNLKANSSGSSTITITIHDKNIPAIYADAQISFKVSIQEPNVYKVPMGAVANIREDLNITDDYNRVLCSASLGGWLYKQDYVVNGYTHGNGNPWRNAAMDKQGPAGYDYNFGGDDCDVPRNEYGNLAVPNNGDNVCDMMFNVPTDGSYIVFMPKTNGTITAHIYQHYKNGAYVCVVNESNTTLKSVTGVIDSNSSDATLTARGITGGKSFRTDKSAPVRYTFDVSAGKTYYLYNYNSQVSLFGYEFQEAFYKNMTIPKDSKRSYLEQPEGGLNNVKHTNAGCVSTVTFDRTFKGGVWNSVILPFSMNEKQIEKTFGPLYGKYESSMDNPTSYIMYFDRVDDNGKIHFMRHAYNTIVSGKPFMIMPLYDTQIKTSKLGDDKYVYAVETANTGSVTFGSNENGFEWRASYHRQTVEPGDYYFGNGVLTRRNTKNANLKAMQGILKATTETAKQTQVMSIVIDGFDDEDDVTYIMQIDVDDDGYITMRPVEDDCIYDINGIKVSEDAKSLYSLPAGVYILNGKKYNVK